MSAQFWQGVVAGMGGWLALSLTGCAAIACLLRKARTEEHAARAALAMRRAAAKARPQSG